MSEISIVAAGTLLALHLVHLTGPDRIGIDLNPAEVVTVREPRDTERIVHKDVNCLVFTADGKFIAVIEDCTTVRALIENSDQD